MSADLVIAAYVRIAKQDLEGARLLSRAGNRNAPYLCEQAAEKLIRSVLTSEGIHGGTPSPRGRIKPPPTPAELDLDLAKLDTALAEVATRFKIDLTKPDGPAGNVDPIR